MQREFPAETTVDATDPANNQPTLQNIRLWDWHALQDTLQQIQEIRTYYDFPDVDIDRYQIDGSMREVMLAVFDEDVPSGSQRASCEPRVRLDRAGDYYDVSARYGFFVAPEPLDSVGRSRIDAWIVASGDLVAALESAKYPGMHSAHGAQAHQRDLVSSTRSFHASVRPGKMARLGRCLRAQRGQREPEFRSEGSRANSLWRAS